MFMQKSWKKQDFLFAFRSAGGTRWRRKCSPQWFWAQVHQVRWQNTYWKVGYYFFPFVHFTACILKRLTETPSSLFTVEGTFFVHCWIALYFVCKWSPVETSWGIFYSDIVVPSALVLFPPATNCSSSSHLTTMYVRLALQRHTDSCNKP